jgi:hypothetical protein
MKLKTPFALTALSLILSAGALAHAATLIALDLPALVRDSDYVVVANAEHESARYQDKLIVTDTTLRVITSLKGSAKPGATLIATHLGGAIDRVGLRVPGAAQFKLGESAIVFLRRAGEDLNVTGMSQGVLPITGAGASAQVLPGGSGATLMQRASDGTLTEKPAQPAPPRSLSDMLAEIERLAAQ